MNAGLSCEASYILNMTVAAFLLAALAAVVIGISVLLLFLLGAHWLSVQVARQIEKFIDPAT
jgi:hypothetical protein